MKLLYLTFLFFLSCGSIKFLETVDNTVSLSEKSFQNSFQSVCLLGSGRGKVAFGDKKYGFSYESAFQGDDFLIEVSIPFLGGEMMKVEKTAKGYRFSGGFYNLLKRGFNDYSSGDESYKNDDLSKFLGFIAKEIYRVRDLKNNLTSGPASYYEDWCKNAPENYCRKSLGSSLYMVGPHFFEIQKSVEDFNVYWINTKLSTETESKFQQSDFILKRNGQSLLATSFYPKSCHSGPQ